MITFNQVCEHFGLEPKAVRAIIKSGKEYKIEIIAKEPSKQQMADDMLELLKWFVAD